MTDPQSHDLPAPSDKAQAEGDRAVIDRELERAGSQLKQRAPGDEGPPGAGTGEDVCPACHGSGRIQGKTCETCAGSGKILRGIGGA